MRFTLVSIDASRVSSLIERHDFRVRTQMKMNATEKGSNRERGIILTARNIVLVSECVHNRADCNSVKIDGKKRIHVAAKRN